MPIMKDGRYVPPPNGRRPPSPLIATRRRWEKPKVAKPSRKGIRVNPILILGIMVILIGLVRLATMK